MIKIIIDITADCVLLQMCTLK